MSAAAAAGGAAGGAASGGEWTGASPCPSLVASRKKKGAAYEERLSARAPEDGVRPGKRRQNTAHRQKRPLRSHSHCNNIHDGSMGRAKPIH